MKKMKSILMGVALVMGSAVASYAQEPQKPACQAPSPEALQEMEANQMAEKLILDDATTAKFLPVYIKYIAELQALCEPKCPAAPACKGPKKPECKGEKKCEKPAEGEKPQCGAPEGGEKPEACPAVKTRKSDAEVDEAIKARLAKARKMVEIQEAYYKEFSKILSPKQVEKVLFHHAKAQKKQGGKQGKHPQGGFQPQGGEPMPMGQPCPQGQKAPAPQA